MSTPTPATQSPDPNPHPAFSTSKIDFHPQGDVILVLGTDSAKFKFRVSSQMLCLASPVFLAMLGRHSGFKEAEELRAGQTTGSPVKIPLPEDDPAPLTTILFAIHNCFDMVPRVLTEAQLYDVAVLCDKYDMRRAVGVWVELVWVPALNLKPPPVLDSCEYNRWIYMTYVFGLRDAFKTITQRFIVTHGSCLTDSSSGKHHRFTELLPEAVLRAMENVRYEANRGMLECAHKLLNDYLSNEAQTKCKSGAVKDGDDVILGGVIRALRNKDLYPLPDPTTRPAPVGLATLNHRLTKLDISYFYTIVVTTPKSCTCGRCVCRSSYHSDNKMTVHKFTCSPLRAFAKEIEAIHEGVEGLDYDKFI